MTDAGDAKRAGGEPEEWRHKRYLRRLHLSPPANMAMILFILPLSVCTQVSLSEL